MKERAADYCTDLALLLRHGVPQADATSVLASERTGGESGARVASRVAAGEALSDAVEELGLPAWARAVIAAGEASGTTPRSLGIVAAQLKNEAAWRARMSRALAYPLLVVALSVIMGLFLCRTILPTLSTMVEEFGASLPAASRLALALGRAAGSPVVLTGAIVLISGTAWLVADDERLRAAAVHLPGLKRTATLAETWRYFGVAASLLEASVPVDRALELAAAVVTPPSCRHAVTEAARHVRAGELPSVALGLASWLPRRTTRVLAIAETTGAMAEAFASLRDHAEVALTRDLDSLARWAPVALVTLAAAIVAFLTQALLVPSFQVDIAP